MKKYFRGAVRRLGILTVALGILASAVGGWNVFAVGGVLQRCARQQEGRVLWQSRWNAAVETEDPFFTEVPDYLDDGTGPHAFGSWQTETEATLTEGGRERRTCLLCGLSESRDTPSLLYRYRGALIAGGVVLLLLFSVVLTRQYPGRSQEQDEEAPFARRARELLPAMRSADPVKPSGTSVFPEKTAGSHAPALRRKEITAGTEKKTLPPERPHSASSAENLLPEPVDFPEEPDKLGSDDTLLPCRDAALERDMALLLSGKGRRIDRRSVRRR